MVWRCLCKVKITWLDTSNDLGWDIVKNNFWETLEPPWQACLDEAWKAYCSGSLPIGAVICDESEEILVRGRNSIFQTELNDKTATNRKLLHAELAALQSLDEANQPSAMTLYSTMEPCPMCFGAWYMSSVKSLHFVARDAYAGSTNLRGKTWYLQWKNRQIEGPVPGLEKIVLAMHVEFDVRVRKRADDVVLERWKEVLPEAVEFGKALAEAGTLEGLAKKGTGVDIVINRIEDMLSSKN
ncbi:MAG: nucleoside deaminase [Chloroflexi bacterium]|nr:MAG: nucleoside deaminase [Chloroflexota bacterium]MBL1195667.1 nucleoside deaminase [Chloroflexota bacterium]